MKLHNITRSLFVALAMCLVGIPAMAEVHLNPFAYRIGNYKATNMVEKSGAALQNDNFVINYALSGDATSVIVRFWNASSTWTRANGNNGATLLAEIDITNEKDSEGKGCNKKGYHTYMLDFTHVVGQSTTAHNQTLRWTIDVKGGNQLEYKDNNNFINANKVTETIGFRYPGAVDVCDDPYDYNFGAVFCTESRVVAAGDDPSYISYGKNPTVYVFGGGMEFLPARYYDNHNTYYSFNGLFTSAPYFSYNSTILYARAPHRVRLTEDGRLFLSSLEGGNQILYEITQPANDYQNNFYEPHKEGSKVHSVFNSGTWSLANLRLNTTSGSYFIASPNSGMDVRGTDGSLELLLLSANTEKDGDYTANPTSGVVYPGINQKEWHLSRYSLGTKTTWEDKKCSEEILDLIKTNNGLNANNALTNNVVATDKTKLGDAMLVGYDHVGIEYDLNGGCWIVQYRENDGVAATVVHYNATTKKVDFEEHVSGRNSGGVRHNYDFSKLAVAGGKKNTKTFTYKPSGSSNTYTYNGEAATEGQITIYSVSYKNGAHTFSDEAYIAANGGGFHDFAWDFADNLYAADSKSHKLVAYALPHRNKTASTPSMSQFNFKMSPVYAFNVAVNPTVSGADTYATIKHARIGKAPYPNYLHNANINLVAEEILDGCKFYQWSGYVNTATENGNRLTISSLSDDDTNINAEIGICAYENKAVLAVKKQTTFPAAFVKRDMDNVSYSTICFPFDVATLTDELAGASVLKFTGTTIEKVENGCTHLNLNFEEVTFTGDDIIKAGIPYLIQPKNNITGEFTINRTVTCPTNLDENGYGGKNVTYNGVTFHGLVNGATFTPDENRLFLVANDRLANLTSTGSINGLRAFFTVSGASSKIVCKINTPDKVSTSIAYPTLSDSLQTTKYLWNGQIYIKRGDEIYDLSGARVK